ncbi:transposase [Photobacterium galatheae]|uniref:Transposase n=1 Tax=Photobacterium galatheae TaxID=1654360 RepID=A0A066S084_9GAMM|nr:transposase [Photobacterium galatheae]KDM93347.1 transposase [Photobacterium galatheae]MCM0150470.1 transposase [Photobacterium galatheae]
MTTARSQLICPEATPYYHCVSRCVRRSFLCGYDEQTQTSYEHRRAWVERRLMQIADAFCVDVCAYAIMSNHYHLVLHINQEKAQKLSDEAVIQRWITFHRTPVLIHRFLKQELASESEKVSCQKLIQTWRTRLCSISWFMRLLNQYIATEANLEDGCTGHFWEGRFKSQALLDEQALAAALAYVDLNPVRAGIADTPESSAYTSVKARLQPDQKHHTFKRVLYPFTGHPRNDRPAGLPFRLMDYLELLDWTSRQIRENKPGHIPPAFPTILTRLGFESQFWLETCQNIEKGTLVGSKTAIRTALPYLNRRRRTGLTLSPS